MQHASLFSEKQVGVSAVLGGPVPAGILFYLNYKRLGKEREAYQALAITLLFAVLMFFTIMSIPDDIAERIPNALFTGIYGIVVYFAFRHFLAEEVARNITPDRPSASNWAVAGIVFLGILISFVIILIFAVWQPAFPGDKLTFGKGHEIYFDKEEISAEDVNKLGRVLLSDGFFGDDGEVAVRLETLGKEFRIRVPIQKEYWNDLEVEGYFGDLKLRLQQLYQKNVSIVLEHHPISGRTERKII